MSDTLKLQQAAEGGCPPATCSEFSSLDEVLAGNALFFLLDLRPLYDFVNASDAPRNVKDCLRRINLAAASIECALGSEGYDRAKERDAKIKADLEAFISQNAIVEAPPDTGTKKSMKLQPNTEAAETARTTDSPAVSSHDLFSL